MRTILFSFLRYQESALSMALLIELGNIPHIMEERGENKNILLTESQNLKSKYGPRAQD